jgi:poly(A) polymerase
VTPRGSLSKMIAPSSRGTWNVSNPTTMPISVFGMVQNSPSHTGTCRRDIGGSAKAEGYRDCVMAMIDVDPVARELGERFNAAGFELYLVGGVVRDAMLGRISPDMDLATSAKPHETTKVLQGWADSRYHVGVRFGTVGARKGTQLFEITTFREEVYAEEHRKPAVTFAKDIQTDLSRRDFTINAMAVRLPDGEFIDPFGGVKHLAAKVLDTPLEPEIAFSDDPLRMLRAARFVSQLDVTPSERVVRAITEMRDRLSIVSAERIHAELDRLLVGARPSAGLALIVETGLSDLFLPELSALQLEQDPVHQHKDVLLHTYAVVERCEPDLVLRLAGLLHDIGKPKTKSISPDGVQFHHHEIVGARMAEARMKELHYSNPMVEDVRKLVELHLRFHGYGEGWTDSAVRRYVRDAGPLLDRLNQLTRADCTTRNVARARKLEQLQDELEERIARLAEEENLNALRPPIDGAQVMKHLGIPPGPLVGEALAYLFEVRMERGPIPEDEAFELLDAWARERDLGV